MKHKRIFRTLLMAICATMAGVPFTSCSDSETESTDVTESAKVALSISASKQNGSGSDARKADYDADEFEDGDEIGLYVLLAEDKQSAYIDEETCYNVRATYDGSSWTLDNVIYLSEDVEAYIIAYYPYDESIGHTMYTSEEGTLLFDLTPSGSEQTDVLASGGVIVSSDSPQANLSLSHVLTRITLTIEVADDITTSRTLTSMSISADELYGDVGLYIDENGSFQTYSQSTVSSLKLSIGETLSGGDETTVDFLIPSGTSATLTVALVIDDTKYIFEIEEDEWAAGYQYNYSVTVTTDEDDGDDDDNDNEDDDDGDDDDDSDDDDEETSSTTYEAVDLGDGVSVLWATMNVGASSVEDYGNYYAWGEITVSSDGSYGSNSGFKLYGDSSATDFSGNASYDAATYNWGSSWRMPTRAEMVELFDECSTYETTTYNGVYGCLITGTNGKTIFLPSGGYYDSYGFQSKGSQGLYWTSTPTSSSRGAYGLKTITNTSSSATYSIGSHTRSDGYLIRAVHDKEDSSSE